MSAFAHLHCHTKFSLLDGASDIDQMYKKAVADGMPGIAITDHGNMFGVFKFVAEAARHNVKGEKPKIKPIVGCEFYMVENRFKKQFTKQNKDIRYHQLMIAKNAEGYTNLCKLSSLGYVEGLYSKYPRIDKELILKYHKGLIATSCCLGAIIPQMILNEGEKTAEAELKWWLDLFGEDYYIELQRHGIPEQEEVNRVLLGFAKKYNVKVIATNDSHYIEQEDSNTHDILLCVNTGEKQSTPKIGDFAIDEVDNRNTRFGFYNNEFYFKNTGEMKQLFAENPESIENTLDIVGKVEHLNLKKDIMLPHFQVPSTFKDQDLYLRHLTLQGANKRYKEITPEIQERLDFELHTIARMGYAGYFLIVEDFIRAGKDIGVLVGPGRGSAAGSAVAYCVGITNIDPIKYNLLFERFLNPDRKSMPDIDTDFDDEGRQKVIDYVIDKYGKNQVAQIITYGTMAAKSAIKDVARVLDLPLSESNELTKMVPAKTGLLLNRLLTASINEKDENSLQQKEELGNEDMALVHALREIHTNKSDLRSQVLSEALKLEGTVRNVGVHAAGVIIAPKDLMEILPVATAKDSDLLVTQYDGNSVENVGVIKMDFLGLKTLSIIKDTLDFIEYNHGIKIDIDKLPLDDEKTYQLFQRGDTFGTFQFESQGMTKHLKDLKPDRLEDLIIMNALFRPGPMEKIPNYIRRKHGMEEVVYDIPEMQDILEETYGITVYQEQVMLLSQKLAGFSKGDADTLRKAMGKKDRRVIDSMKGTFMEGIKANGHDLKAAAKVWSDWEAFASYAFNKSHATCYAYVAYQTAYLKANYLPEFMAANLKHQGNIEKISQYMAQCKLSGLDVLGPDVNESRITFAVSRKGIIRFGLSAIKGVGEGPSSDILEGRQDRPFDDIYDFVVRVNSRSINKKTMEALVYSGALDCFGLDRAAYFSVNDKGNNFIETLIRYAASVRDMNENATMSLFGDDHSMVITAPEPSIFSPWSITFKLEKEKEMIGLYASGHPLDTYRLELDSLCNYTLPQLAELSTEKINIFCGGMVTSVFHGTTKSGEPYCKMELTDFEGSHTFYINKELYHQARALMVEGNRLYVEGITRRRWEHANIDIGLKSITLLENVSEKYLRSLTLKIPIRLLTEDLIKSLNQFINKNLGKQSLKIVLLDESEQMSLTTNCYQKIIINQLLIELVTNQGMEYTVERN